MTFKNLAKHSTDFQDDDDESVKDKNEDVEEDKNKIEKGWLIFLYIYVNKSYFTYIAIYRNLCDLVE